MAEDDRFASLSRTIRMFRRYLEHMPGQVTDLFGLPLEGERDRRLLQLEERREREEAWRQAASDRAAAAREAEIRQAAHEMLGSDADAWLITEQADLCGTPLTASRNVQTSLVKALNLAQAARLKG